MGFRGVVLFCIIPLTLGGGLVIGLETLRENSGYFKEISATHMG